MSARRNGGKKRLGWEIVLQAPEASELGHLGVYGSRCARSANTRCARSAGLNIKSLTKWGTLEVFSDRFKRESNGKMTNKFGSQNRYKNMT